MDKQQEIKNIYNMWDMYYSEIEKDPDFEFEHRKPVIEKNFVNDFEEETIKRMAMIRILDELDFEETEMKLRKDFSTLLVALTILRDNLGSTFRFHEINDINETSPKVACEAYQRDIKNALISIEKALQEVGYNISKSVMEKE